MTMLEMFNREAARPLIATISENIRILAPNVMFFVATKVIIIPILNLILLFFMAFAGWEVVDGSKKRKMKKNEDFEVAQNGTAVQT